MKVGAASTAQTAPDLLCPACGGSLGRLARGQERLRCALCRREYPVIFGIPDLRLRADPYLDLESDRRKAARLAELFEGRDLRALIEEYWRLTPGTPPHLARTFVEQALQGSERGHDLLDLLERDAAPEELRRRRVHFLEVGCRGGGLVAAARQRGYGAVGIDLALRWLVIARKQLDAAGVDALLVAADAGRLPFADACFSTVVAEHVLEHTRKPAALLREAHRVLGSGGLMLATTWNRMTPMPEPHVGLVGVGWLPLPLARAYVRYRRQDPYEHIYLRSPPELGRLMRASPFRGARVAAAPVGERRRRRFGAWVRRAAASYDRLCERWPWRWLARLCGPILQIRCRRLP